jgi:hypothetical protein
MTDTTKLNGDRDRPSGREADIGRHRRLNAAVDGNYRPHRRDHLNAAHKKSGKTPEEG